MKRLAAAFGSALFLSVLLAACSSTALEEVEEVEFDVAPFMLQGQQPWPAGTYYSFSSWLPRHAEIEDAVAAAKTFHEQVALLDAFFQANWPHCGDATMPVSQNLYVRLAAEPAQLPNGAVAIPRPTVCPRNGIWRLTPRTPSSR